MPVPQPLAFREAPSGVGVTRTAGWTLELGVGGSESRRGWEELLPEHSFGPCCALSQVKDGVVCRPRKGRASVAACSPILPRRKWRARETDIREVWGTLTFRAPLTLYPVSLLPSPCSLILIALLKDTALLGSSPRFHLLWREGRAVDFPL